MKNKVSIGKFVIQNNTYFILILLLVICAIISPDFFTGANLINLLKQNAALTIMVIGMLFVILTGGIDLSVGSIYALGSVMTAWALTTAGIGMVWAIIIPIVMGAVLGLITGFFVAYSNMAAFVASMAMMTMARGLAFLIANGHPVQCPDGSIGALGVAMIGNIIPWLSVLALFVCIIFWIVYKYTGFGRVVIAIGSNEDAVRLAGIRTRPVKMSVYAISGACSGLAGIIAASRTNIGTPIIGSGMELDAIASCVIGGASLSGGIGSVPKAVVGVFVLAFIGNIMNLLAVPAYPQDIIKGAIIVFAVVLQQATNKKNETV